MTEEVQEQQKKHGRIWWALAALVVLLAVLFVPPFLSVTRYKSQITSLMAASLGRPVHISSMHMRLLPRPGFVFYNLTVDEDPAFGAEPILRANTVTASIRLLSLWRGRLELGEVSVDEASLNLVRSPEGNLNLESLFRTSAKNSVSAQGGARRLMFPYLAASNSRVNFKNGAEKLPFSIVDTDLSFWQENPGEWRLRLRGQPARTDVSLNLGDTGIVEVNATLKNAAELRQMPVVLDMEWRDAQLGQLTRIATGSDSGWRGDMRGNIHIEGNAVSAQIKTRLRADNVHRAEFQPVSAMDFDANCGFVYHYSARALEQLVCDSPLGNGHVRLAGTLPGNTGGQPHFSVELDKIPVEAGLDALRTVRSGVDPSLQATGTASGKVTYDEMSLATDAGKKPSRALLARKGAAAKNAQAPGPLTGSFTIDGIQLSGGGLSKPIVAPKLVLEPAPAGQAPALVGAVAVPLGGATPLAVSLRLGLKGYQVGMKGQVSIAEGRELARATGITQAAQLTALAGEPFSVDLNAAGPWMPAPELYFSAPLPAAAAARVAVPSAQARAAAAAPETRPDADTLTGTVTLRNANWKSDYLASHVGITDATFHVNLAGSLGESRWDPVDFTYGPLKGTASITVPIACDTPAACPMQFQVQFAELDAATVQTAILGAHEKGTLVSDLINRLRPAAPPLWPEMQGTVKASSLVLGPVTLKDATMELHLQPTGAEITSLDAKLLGGAVHGTGTVTAGNKPAYELEGSFEKLNPTAVGQMLGQTWRGGTFNANGKVELAGYTGEDLASSAKGALHFEWSHGAASGTVPAALARFDRWTADAAIADAKITLGQNTVAEGSHKQAVEGSVPFADPLKVVFPALKQPAAKKAQK